MSEGIFAPGFLRSFNNAKTPVSEIRDLPLSEVLVNEQVRKNFKDEDVAALAQSIKKIGCIEPIVVWGPDITRGRKYHLICGEMRYRAHALLGKATIRAVITTKPQSDEDLKILQLAENYNRSSLSPFEMADALAVLRKSMDVNDLMAVFSLKSSSIYAYLQITELDARERAVLKDQSLAALLKYCKLKKTRPGAAQALAHGVVGGADDPSDLARGVALVVVQVDRLALRQRERHHGAEHALVALPERVLAGRLRRRRLRHVVEPHRRMSAAVAQQVPAGVGRHAYDPGALVAGVAERLVAADELHERVLADVLGAGRRAQVGVAHAQDEVGVFAHEPLGVAVGRVLRARHRQPPLMVRRIPRGRSCLPLTQYTREGARCDDMTFERRGARKSHLHVQKAGQRP